MKKLIFKIYFSFEIVYNYILSNIVWNGQLLDKLAEDCQKLVIKISKSVNDIASLNNKISSK